MPIDQVLLSKSREEAARLAEAERQVLLARAEYHSAVRRLHLAGASLRDVARALGISHQRVQQIVGAAGGSWWQRAWRSRRFRRDAVCTFCERPPGEVKRLIAGPNVFICDRCVSSAEQALAHLLPGNEMRRANRAARCSFCNRRHSRNRAVVTGTAARVCEECVHTCRGILAGADPEPA